MSVCVCVCVYVCMCISTWKNKHEVKFSSFGDFY